MHLGLTFRQRISHSFSLFFLDSHVYFQRFYGFVELVVFFLDFNYALDFLKNLLLDQLEFLAIGAELVGQVVDGGLENFVLRNAVARVCVEVGELVLQAGHFFGHGHLFVLPGPRIVLQSASGVCELHSLILDCV